LFCRAALLKPDFTPSGVAGQGKFPRSAGYACLTFWRNEKLTDW
jgi:hypothetical protein